MSQWHREHPDLVGTEADPWMMHESYRRASGYGEHIAEAPVHNGDPDDHYSLAQLEALPTLRKGQADNLKIETEDTRVWLCRCGIADGMPHDNNVTVERLIDGCWTTAQEYEAR